MGKDAKLLILGITSLNFVQIIVALQACESFFIFHVDATFKLSELGYPATLFIVNQVIQREYYEHAFVDSVLAVWATSEQSVVRVMYLCDVGIEAMNAQTIYGLSEVKFPNNAGAVRVCSNGWYDAHTTLECDEVVGLST
ncbi:hypothetical protein PHMEG_00017729 [Phytophthora megakarya]|uniref:Uncharacterized protein n=1 Tax=Phytophthora megakarya TaxID=4795 RepID=A0A225VW40_9STRA|nr:hypothetical protein PHMEG_00017729 [Phytophthora megakarya]